VTHLTTIVFLYENVTLKMAGLLTENVGENIINSNASQN